MSLVDWEPKLAAPITLQKLADVTVGKKRLERAIPGELYRATCDKPDCKWTGDWRSVWNDWETLLIEVEDDYLQHMLVNHGNNHAPASNE